LVWADDPVLTACCVCVGTQGRALHVWGYTDCGRGLLSMDAWGVRMSGQETCVIWELLVAFLLVRLARAWVDCCNTTH
jgi:hypothetical protein